MIGIYESNNNEIDEDNLQLDFNQDSKLDASSQEIKNVLDKFKF